MKTIKTFSLILLGSFLLLSPEVRCAANQQKKDDPTQLDMIIPANRFLAHLELLKPRDTTKPTTTILPNSKTWADSGAAFIRHIKKNYTEQGCLEYVADSDNPSFFRLMTEHAIKQTPLEQQLGDHTYEQHLFRTVERSQKAQTLIIQLLRKHDERNIPTKDGAEAMLRTIDSCYLAIPDMNLMLAKIYLQRYTKAYGEQALFNDNIMKELQFLPLLINMNTTPLSSPPPPGQQSPAPPSSPIAISPQQPHLSPPQAQSYSPHATPPHHQQSPSQYFQSSGQLAPHNVNAPTTSPDQPPPNVVLTPEDLQ